MLITGLKSNTHYRLKVTATNCDTESTIEMLDSKTHIPTTSRMTEELVMSILGFRTCDSIERDLGVVWSFEERTFMRAFVILAFIPLIPISTPIFAAKVCLDSDLTSDSYHESSV